MINLRGSNYRVVLPADIKIVSDLHNLPCELIRFPRALDLIV